MARDRRGEIRDGMMKAPTSKEVIHVNRLRSCAVGGAAMIAAASFGLALPAPVLAAPAASPSITATPSNLMVNSKTVLKGSGFAPSKKIHLEECGAIGWPVPQSPCVAKSKIAVTTDANGAFKTSFVARVCDGRSNGVMKSKTCYIGEEKPSGVDTITLVGAVKVIVTYP